MKRILPGLGIVALVLLALGVGLYFLIPRPQVDLNEMAQAATFDLAKALAGSMRRVEATPQFEVDGLITRVRLRIKNTGKAACEYKLLEYKLQGQAPKEARFPFAIARLEPDQAEEIELTYENVAWEWTDKGASVYLSQKFWSSTLPPKDAPPGSKPPASLSGEGYSMGQVNLDEDQFRKALPTLKGLYPELTTAVSLDATAQLDGDVTTANFTLTNTGRRELLDFSVRGAKLNGNGEVVGELDADSRATVPAFKPGESKSFRAEFRNAPWDFAKSDPAHLVLVVDFGYRPSESVTFKGATFLPPKADTQDGLEISRGLLVKKPAAPSPPAK